jgi:hypothetical protein
MGPGTEVNVARPVTNILGGFICDRSDLPGRFKVREVETDGWGAIVTSRLAPTNQSVFSGGIYWGGI